jgi:virginiamycin B lyase
MASVGMIDAQSNVVTMWRVPAPVGETRVINGLTLGSDGALWLTSTGANALIRYAPQENAYTFYALTIPKSVPYGLTRDRQGTLWFTADGGDEATYVGRLSPQSPRPSERVL